MIKPQFVQRIENIGLAILPAHHFVSLNTIEEPTLINPEAVYHASIGIKAIAATMMSCGQMTKNSAIFAPITSSLLSKMVMSL